MDMYSPYIFYRTGLGWQLLRNELDACIKKFNPDIIHFHSIMPLGFDFVNKYSSDTCKSVLTLHTYAPLCANDSCTFNDDGSLCDLSDASQCCRCYPLVQKDIFIRHRQLVLENLEQVDMLITPGAFAKKLYVAAGIHPDKIKVIRNGTQFSPIQVESRREVGKIRLGFVGRNSSLKGLNILLSALLLLPLDIRNSGAVHLFIFGPLNENDTATFYNVLSEEYVKQVFSFLRPLKSMISLYGKFQHADIPELMSKVDCIVIPSTWWEVTPCVIQEAFACRKPVVCSNIGGMAEMVTDHVDGLHFDVGNASDLKDIILKLLNDKDLLPRLQKCIKAPPTIENMAEGYISLYEGLLSPSRGPY